MYQKISNLAVVAALMALSQPVLAGAPDYDAVAANLVNESLAVRPGEIIQISGTPDQVKLMAAIQVAVARAGGESFVTLSIPEANKRAVMETDMEHLQRTPTLPVMIVKMIDGFINVGSQQDPALFSDVPEDRMAAGRQATAQVNHVFKNAQFRSVSLGQTGGIPTAEYAKSIGANYAELDSMFWQALAVSPAQIYDAATIVTGMLSPGIDVHVASDNGTDLRFRVAQQNARVNAGRTKDVITGDGPAQVWLPAGEAYTAIEPGSAQGTLAVDQVHFRGRKIEKLRMTFRDGKLTELTGKNAGQLEEFFKSSDDATRILSVMDIGLNPYSKQLKGSDYRSWEMGGMLSLGVGNNLWAGGNNTADGSFSVQLPKATVDVGGARLSSAGRLPDQVLAVYKQ